jgi:2-amino-4-hydroxy-6-hydroxymethyldihydropteridine diphosphokinase
MFGNESGIFILLGANLGNATHTFNAAIEAVKSLAHIVKASAIYKSEAWGMDEVPPFYNQVIQIETTLTAQETIDGLLLIEKTLGRTRNIHNDGYQSRTIDLDLLLYNMQVINQPPNYTIPHPRLHLRNFTLVPLCEIAAKRVHPVMNKTIEELLKQSPDSLKVWKV